SFDFAESFRETLIEFRDAVGMIVGDVLLLSGVFGEVEQFKAGAFVALDQLPRALANDAVGNDIGRAIVREMPEEFIAIEGRFAPGGDMVPNGNSVNVFNFGGRRGRKLRGLAESGEDINCANHGAGGFSWGDDAGPSHDQRDTNSAFVGITL